MSTLTRTAATALSVTLMAVVPATAHASTHAPAPRGQFFWTTVGTYHGGQDQACKQTTSDGKSWRVYTRFVNTGKKHVGGGVGVSKDGKKTKQQASTPLIAPGKTSYVGSVILPKKGRYSLDWFAYESKSGTGGPVTISKVIAC